MRCLVHPFGNCCCAAIAAEMDFRKMEELRLLEVADIVSASAKETVFKGAGLSHFSFVQGKGFHVTTNIPGLKQGIEISEHDPVSE